MTKEQKFYQWFHSQLKGADIMRVENSMMRGVPDLNICWDGCEIWVELKVYEGGRVLIRPDQYAWGSRRCFHRGKVFIVAEHPTGLLHAWKFPHISAIPHGKYLQLTNMPRACNEGDELINYLFTS